MHALLKFFYMTVAFNLTWLDETSNAIGLLKQSIALRVRTSIALRVVFNWHGISEYRHIEESNRNIACVVQFLLFFDRQ